jgi:hypothetical protein
MALMTAASYYRADSTNSWHVTGIEICLHVDGLVAAVSWC